MTDRIDEQHRLTKQIQDKKLSRERHESKVFASKLRAVENRSVIATRPENGGLPKKETQVVRLSKQEACNENGNDRKPPIKKLKEPAKKAHAKAQHMKESQNSELFLRLSAQMPQLEHTPSATPSSTPLPTLSAEAIDEIIESIERSTSLAGHHSVTIDLRSNVLSGARIHMSVQHRTLRLLFARTDEKTRALLRSSRRAFERRLKEKNLALSDFLVH